MVMMIDLHTINVNIISLYLTAIRRGLWGNYRELELEW